MSVAFGHGLELVYFRVQKKKDDGSWETVSSIGEDKQYRYIIKFKNINAKFNGYAGKHTFLWVE
jgi:hypothetical protein